MGFSKISLRTFFRNLYNLFAYDYHELNVERRWQWVELRNYATMEKMRRFLEEDASAPYRDELEYICRCGVQTFPYAQLKRLETVESGCDARLKMPFVLHKGKKLFFPQDVSKDKAEWYYHNFIERENLLGGNYMEKMPHCYQSEQFKVNDGDVFVDVGAAEGLVALDVIDKVSKVIIIESDKRWIKALRATFEPYKDKCVIIPKLVTNCNGKKTITLDRLLENETDRPIFVKMDIEGYEKTVLEAAKGFLSQHDNIKLACCTYHAEHDAQTIVSILDQIGYHHEFSDGWMLFSDYDKSLLNPPFFRHGVVRAWKW